MRVAFELSKYSSKKPRDSFKEHSCQIFSGRNSESIYRRARARATRDRFSRGFRRAWDLEQGALCVSRQYDSHARDRTRSRAREREPRAAARFEPARIVGENPKIRDGVTVRPLQNPLLGLLFQSTGRWTTLDSVRAATARRDRRKLSRRRTRRRRASAVLSRTRIPTRTLSLETLERERERRTQSFPRRDAGSSVTVRPRRGKAPALNRRAATGCSFPELGRFQSPIWDRSSVQTHSSTCPVAFQNTLDRTLE